MNHHKCATSILAFLFVWICFPTVGQTTGSIRNAQHELIATVDAAGWIRDHASRCVVLIESDGTIRNTQYQRIGEVKGGLRSAGVLRDKSLKIVGRIDADGTIRTPEHVVLGRIDQDGAVRDAQYRVKGIIENVSTAHTALFFFFLDALERDEGAR